MSIGSTYWPEEVARRKDCFFYNEEQQEAIRKAGYFTRRQLNEMGAVAVGESAEGNWFEFGGQLYGRTACVFSDQVPRFRKLLSGRLLLELA